MNISALDLSAELDRRLSIGRAGDPAIFTEYFDELAHSDASSVKSGAPLAGVFVSIKDMIDVGGYRSRAGCEARADCDIAVEDAPSVSSLRKAGAILLGHTNMTELAYSGLGLNPHYGTPRNAIWSDAVPGGSTSGGAVSVAAGIADIALGTDTGGSLRIPAAFNGLVGFKPSQGTVSLSGCVSLSSSLDSIGPIARTVRDATNAWKAIRRAPGAGNLASTIRRIVIPNNFGFDGMDEAVRATFAVACASLDRGGIRVEQCSLPLVEEYEKIALWQFAAVEGHCTHRELIEKHGDRLDPRVLSRLAMGTDVKATDYLQTCRQREAFRRRFSRELENMAILMPTVAILPPKLAAMESDDSYFATNRLVLRNTTLANIADGCSISVPFTHSDQTIGLMLTAPNAHDEALLSLALQIEQVFSRDETHEVDL